MDTETQMLPGTQLRGSCSCPHCQNCCGHQVPGPTTTPHGPAVPGAEADPTAQPGRGRPAGGVDRVSGPRGGGRTVRSRAEGGWVVGV